MKSYVHLQQFGRQNWMVSLESIHSPIEHVMVGSIFREVLIQIKSPTIPKQIKHKQNSNQGTNVYILFKEK